VIAAISPEEFRTYCIYGLTLVSDFSFASRLLAGSGPPDVTFTCAVAPPISGDGPPPAPVYVSRFRTARGESNCSFHRCAGFDLLRFPDVADFYFVADRILGRPVDPDDLGSVEIHLLGTVLSCWLERAGVPCLHASATVAGGGAVGFLTFNGGGKSTLAAALAEVGCPILTDDVLAVRMDGTLAQPAYPQVRLWPSEAAHFLGPDSRFPRVDPRIPKMRVPMGPGGLGSFAAAEAPLRCIYVPERRPPGEGGNGIDIQPIRPRDAVIELLRHSFIGPLAEAACGRERRLDQLARLAARVPLRRLIYPDGLEHLPHVVETVLADLEERPGAGP